MVGHEQEKLHPPIAALIPKRDRFKQTGGDVRKTELIAPTWSTADRNEENRVLGANKRGNIVRQWRS